MNILLLHRRRRTNWMVHGFQGLARTEWYRRRAGRSSSSGIFSQVTQYWNCSTRFKDRWHKMESNLNETRISFMSMVASDQNFRESVSNSTEVQAHAHKSPEGHWPFFGPGTEQKWYGMHMCKPERQWNRSAEMMKLTLRESGHPVFRATSALDRGFLKSKKGGQLSIHYDGDLWNAELLLRTIISVNQLSVYGAIADWCGQQISDHAFSSTGKLETPHTLAKYSRTSSLEALLLDEL